MGFLYLPRLIVFVGASICGAILLGIGAHLDSYKWYGDKPGFINLSIAAGVIALLTLPAMLIIDFFLSGVLFTSWVSVELVVTLVAWALCIATAGSASSVEKICTLTDTSPYFSCSDATEAHAAEAFAYISFVILLLYNVALLLRAFLVGRAGQNVWKMSVKEAEL